MIEHNTKQEIIICDLTLFFYFLLFYKRIHSETKSYCQLKCKFNVFFQKKRHSFVFPIFIAVLLKHSLRCSSLQPPIGGLMILFCVTYLLYIQLLIYNDLFSLVNQGCSLQLWVVSLYYLYYILYYKADLCGPNIYNNHSVVKSKSQTLLSNDRCTPFQNSKHVFI